MVVKARFERQEAFEQREAAQRITNHLQVRSACIKPCMSGIHLNHWRPLEQPFHAAFFEQCRFV